MLWTSLLFILSFAAERGVCLKRAPPRKTIVHRKNVTENFPEQLIVNYTACEVFAKGASFAPQAAVGPWNLVYVSPSFAETCRKMSLSPVSFVEAVDWVNSVYEHLVEVPLSLRAITHKLWNLFGTGGSVLLEQRVAPGAMIFLPSGQALRAQPMYPGMTLQAQFKQARDYEYVAFMLCDSEAVYVMSRRYPSERDLETVAAELGVPRRGRALCDARASAAAPRKLVPLRRTQLRP